jgi:CHAT domain-containing protein
MFTMAQRTECGLFGVRMDSLLFQMKQGDTLAKQSVEEALASQLAASQRPLALLGMLSDRLESIKNDREVVLPFAEMTVRLWLKYGEAENECLAKALYLSAKNLSGKGSEELQRQRLDSTIRISKRLRGDFASELVGDCYLLMGNLLLKSGDQVMAGHYFEWSVAQYELSAAFDAKGYPMAMAKYAKELARDGRKEEAIQYGYRQLEVRKTTDSTDFKSQLMGELNLVRLLLDLQEPDSADFHFARARDLLKRGEGIPAADRGEYYKSASDLAEHRKDWSLAALMIDSALMRGSNADPRNMTLLKIRRADLHLVLGNAHEALRDAHQSLDELLPDWSNPDLSSLPKPAQLTDEPNLQTALRCQGTAWAMIAQGQTDSLRTTSLLHALASLSLACDMVDRLRSNFVSGGAKLDLTARTYRQYEQGIEVCLQLYEHTLEGKYIEEAWRFMERSKAMALLSDMQSEAASQWMLPKALQEREQQMEDSLARMEGQDGKSLQWSNLLRSVKEFKALLRRDYPIYYQLKYDLEPQPLDSLQAYLGRQHATVVEYFWGDSACYLMVVTASVVSLQKLTHSHALDSALSNYCNSIAGRETSLKKMDQMLAAAHSLHGWLLNGLPADSSRLIVVPDGPLWALPFEALVTKPSKSWESAEWLLRSHAVQYAYSGSMLLRLRELPLEGNGQLLSYAPLFDGANKSGFGALTHNTLEAKAVASMTGGTVHIGSTASEKNFREEAPRYSVLHIASHARMLEDSPERSGIAFQQEDDGSDGFLSVPELRTLRLNAELAVLSACETGDGRLVRGEGLMSLSRSFTHSGCRSLVMSLWSVDDNATATIMQEFYRNLAQGKEKDEALRQAKLSYLAAGNAHPNKWAAFVSMGDPRSLDIERSGGAAMWWVLAGIAALLLAAGGAWPFRT